jgi:hypothetical protein
MIDLVLERAGQEPGALDRVFVAQPIQAFHDDPFGAGHCGRESRNAQAALFLELHAVAFDKFRVDHRVEPRRVFSERQIDHENLQRLADLGRRQANPRRRVHRFDHVVDQLVDVIRQRLDRTRRLGEERVPESQNRTEHSQAGVPATRDLRGGVESGVPATRDLRGGVESWAGVGRRETRP